MLEICSSSSPSNGHTNKNKFVNILSATAANNANLKHSSNEKDNLFSYVPLSRKVERYHLSNDLPFFSIEFFPPRTENGAASLISRLNRYHEGGPYFCDITWHVSGNHDLDIPTSSLTIANAALNYCCLNTMLHLTCIGLTKSDLCRHLECAKKIGIRNILALRGDKHEDFTTHDFNYASDMVSFIREEYGDYFTIVVAGYPIPHPESRTREHDLQCLKLKVDAGADFIITQLFFDANDFIDFVSACRRIGIKVPIIPGIICINSYKTLLKFASLSGVALPQKMQTDLEPIQSNDEMVRNYGVDFMVQLCRKLIDSKLCPGLHFYTLNQETVAIKVLKTLGLWNKQTIRVLPWKRPANHLRLTESCRPVFWANLPNSYIYRTIHWDKFPCGFWSANFSNKMNKSFDKYYKFLDENCTKKQITELVENKNSQISDLYQIFYLYYCQYESATVETNGNKDPMTAFNENLPFSLPWIQQPNHYVFESLFAKYGTYLLNGLMVTNYLPSLNGLNSEDRRYGWGESDGYLYQKEYIEFFIDCQYLEQLKSIFSKTTNLSYYLSNRNGTVCYNNWPKQVPITLSWALFPNYQLIPSYVADQDTFEIWRQETFDLFDSWLGDKNESVTSSQLLLKHVQNNFLLVCLIDNQFVSTASQCFANIFSELFGKKHSQSAY